jgi:hypothetical protein
MTTTTTIRRTKHQQKKSLRVLRSFGLPGLILVAGALALARCCFGRTRYALNGLRRPAKPSLIGSEVQETEVARQQQQEA